jgi:short-subunit dehydrogenase
MQLQDKRIILTGATGGIGQALAILLAKKAAKLGLVGTRHEALNSLREHLKQYHQDIISIPADLTTEQGQTQIIHDMREKFGGIDVLVNNAGITEFTEFSEQQPEIIERILKVNVIAPMQLTRRVLPEMLDRGSGQIVNIGSTFGSIAFAYFTSYSSSKFALRGFSEALRREIAGTGLSVTYIAPRAVKTALNNSAVNKMAETVKMNMDHPALVARKIVNAIVKEKKDVYLGFPESLFARINSLLPRLIDSALVKQNQIMRKFARHTQQTQS